LELSGCIVTIDAMGCQKEIVKLICEQNADYIITLKKNQGSLDKNVEQLFKSAARSIKELTKALIPQGMMLMDEQKFAIT